jgi:integrase
MAWIVRRDLKTGPRFYVRYSIDGKQAWFSAGKSRKIAEKARAKVETEIAEGRFLQRLRRSTWTLADLEPVYLDHMAKVKPRSVAWRRDRMKQILRALGPDTALESITTETLDALAAVRLREGRSVSTVKNDIAVLRHALRKAHRWKAETGLSEYRLAEWEPLRDEEAGEIEPLSRAEALKVLRAIDRLERSPSHRIREGCLLARLFLATGARPAEILSVPVRYLEPETGRLRLPGLKRGQWRIFELEPGLVRQFAAMGRGRAPGDTVFPPSERPAKDRYKDIWAKIRTAAKVDAPFYRLRHTHAVEFLRQGGTLRQLQHRLGHRSIRTTEKYAPFSKEQAPEKELRWRGIAAGALKGRKRAG